MSITTVEFHFTKTFQYPLKGSKCATFAEYKAGRSYFMQQDIADRANIGGYGYFTGETRVLDDHGEITHNRSGQVEKTPCPYSGERQEGGETGP